MIGYLGTRAGDPLNAHPRAVLRVTIERAGFAGLSFLTGTLTWRGVVERVLDRTATPAAFPLGGALSGLTNDDRVATIDYRVGTHPGSATVGDFAAGVDAASQYARVVQVELRPPVPGFSEGGPTELAAERNESQDAARLEAERTSLTARIADVARGTERVVIAAAIVATVFLIMAYLPPRSRQS